jgi:hypothetical protein
LKIIRYRDFDGIPVEVMRNLSGVLSQPTKLNSDSIEIYPRLSPMRLMHQMLVDASTLQYFPEKWVQVEKFNSKCQYELSDKLVLAKEKARERLRKGLFGDWISPIELVQPDERFVTLKEILLPVFFEEYPAGKVYLVQYDPQFNSTLAVLNILQRMCILRTGDPERLKEYAGSSALSSFSLNVPVELLFYSLSFGLLWTYPAIYGFVGTCQHQRFLVFILDHPFNVEVEEPTGFARMIPGLGNIMNTRVESKLLVPDTYVSPDRMYPLNRRIFSADEVVRYFATYVDAVGSTFSWLNDFDNYGKEDDKNVFDMDFAYAVWLTFYMLLFTQFNILSSRHNALRKFSYFDSVELLTAFMTSSSRMQPEKWSYLVSDAFSRNVLAGHVMRYGGGFGDELAVAVAAIRDDASSVVKNGLLYPKDGDGKIIVPHKENMAFEEFEPALYRALRNTRHGFAIRGSSLLSIHTGEIHNDLPDLSVAMFLGFLMDKTTYPLSRT